MAAPNLQLVQDAASQQNFDAILLAWPSTVPIVTALPAVPVTGTTILFQTTGMAALTPPQMWMLYRTTAGWFPIGATPIVSEVDPYTTIAAPDRAIASVPYIDLPTGAVGPAVALPAPGWYVVEQGYGGYHNTAGGLLAMSYAIGATAASDLDATSHQAAVVSTDIQRSSRVQPAKQFVSAVTLTSKYRTNVGSATFRGPRYMRVTPVLL